MMKKIFTLFSLVLIALSGSAQTTVTLTAEANALEDNSEFTFNGNAVVTVQKNDYMFVRDDSGCGLICGTLDGTFENGQVLSQGWNATKASVNGWVRYTDATGISASGETNATLAAPQMVTTIDESMLNAYVCYSNVTVLLLRRCIQLQDGSTIPMYNMFNMNMPGGGFPGMTGPFYNAYGVIGMDGSTVKFIPVAFEAYVEPEFLRGDVNGNNEVGITDVTALINYLLSGDATGIVLEAADCNQNGSVAITDVTVLINYLLSGSWD